MATLPVVHAVEVAQLADLRPHPANYREHTEGQIGHLVQSLREHGFYRNVIVASDGVILAGHGVVDAARAAGMTEIPVVRLSVASDDPKALKVLTGDNEIARLAAIDDRVLADLLREIRDQDEDGLLGTGYDDEMLANLVFVTRPESEIGDRNDAAAWVGLPIYDGVERPFRMVISFETEDDRNRLMELIGAEKPRHSTRGVWSVWWPPRDREDLAALRFSEGQAAEDGAAA
jgi:hypothetical protein